MSKQSEETPKGLQNDLLDAQRRLIRLEAELEESKASNKRLSTQNSKLRTKGVGIETTEKEVSALSSSVTEHSHDEKKAQEEPRAPVEPTGGLPPAPGVTEKTKGEPTHEVKSWAPRYCPDCGTKNPAFQDEVQCHNCKIGLGAKAKVTSSEFKVCPNCGKGKDNGGGWEFVPGVKVV